MQHKKFELYQLTRTTGAYYDLYEFLVNKNIINYKSGTFTPKYKQFINYAALLITTKFGNFYYKGLFLGPLEKQILLYLDSVFEAPAIFKNFIDENSIIKQNVLVPEIVPLGTISEELGLHLYFIRTNKVYTIDNSIPTTEKYGYRYHEYIANYIVLISASTSELSRILELIEITLLTQYGASDYKNSLSSLFSNDLRKYILTYTQCAEIDPMKKHTETILHIVKTLDNKDLIRLLLANRHWTIEEYIKSPPLHTILDSRLIGYNKRTTQ